MEMFREFEHMFGGRGFNFQGRGGGRRGGMGGPMPQQGDHVQVWEDVDARGLVKQKQ